MNMNHNWKLSGENKLIIFFGILLGIIFIRLYYLQVIQGDFYQKKLFQQHFNQLVLPAKRGDIYVLEKSGKKVSLSENIELYNLYIDPEYVENKTKVISILAPIIYKHFCEINGIKIPDKTTCIKNIEQFSDTQIISEKNLIISGNKEKNLTLQIDQSVEITGNNKDYISSGQLISIISNKLDKIIHKGKRESNYLGFYDNEQLLEELKKRQFTYLEIVNNNYLYIIPTKVSNINTEAKILASIFQNYGYILNYEELKSNLVQKDIRYIKIISNINSQLAKQIKDLKKEFFYEKVEKYPLLHGIGLEIVEKRYYPYGNFLAHVLGYVDKNNNAYYGVEEYYNDILKGKPGKMIGLAAPWIGNIGSNSVEIEKPLDGSDLYLTIDITLQKEVERLAKYYYSDIEPDSLSILVIDPFTGKIKALTNYPTFDPNYYDEVFKIKPLSGRDRIIVDDDTYVGMPVLILSGEKLKIATYEERKNPNLSRYIFKNRLGHQVFIDKNIAFPYEPGSVFKVFTVGIGIDSDEISMYDIYEDLGSIQVGPFKISNVYKRCQGKHSYLHALERSCNVGMTKIAQAIKKNVFYYYLQQIGFGKITGVQLAGEEGGEISALDKYSLARYFNNSFGLGILVTPIQMAVGYSAMVNGGYLLRPTIVDKIYDNRTNEFLNIDKKIIRRIFKDKTSNDIKEALYKVIYEGDLGKLAISGYTLGGKTGTSAIVFKGEYQQGNGWTNGSFVGIITKEHLKYVVVVQVRRPRKSQWGEVTAGKIYQEIAKYIIETEGINN